MKKMHIRMFLPILIVLLVFPIFTWAAFSVLANGYFKRMASMNVGRMAGEVRQNRLRVKKRLPMGEMGKTSYLLISPSLSLEYPTAELTDAGVQELYAVCRGGGGGQSESQGRMGGDMGRGRWARHCQ